MVISTPFQSFSVCVCLSMGNVCRVLLGLIAQCQCMETTKLTNMEKDWQISMFSLPLCSVISTVTVSPVNHKHISRLFFLRPFIPYLILCLVFHHWHIIVYIHWKALILPQNHRSLTVSMCRVLLLVSCLTNVNFINPACVYWCLREK